MNHSQAEILRQALIDLGIGTAIASGAAWPVVAFKEPDAPDNCITVYNTLGTLSHRIQLTGDIHEFYGLQFRIRGASKRTTWSKAEAIRVALDRTIGMRNVTLSGTTYIIYSTTRSSGIITIGRAVPQTNLEVFTINAEAAIDQIG